MKKYLLIVGLVLASAQAWAASPLGGTEELLEPDQAFSLSTRVVNPDTLEAKWKIADGYYMYRDKFKFQVLSGKAQLLDPKFPKGIIKDDPGFGKVEVYHDSVAVQLPLKREGSAAETVKLRITGQGCNEPVGVCYPPITKEVSFNLPAATAAKVKSLDSLKELVQSSSGQDEFLPPDQAFGVSVSAAGKDSLRASFRVAKGYYLYRDKLKFNLVGADGNTVAGLGLGKIDLPKGETKDDPTFGPTVVYHHPFEVVLPVQAGATAMPAILQVHYQGCADKGICYPPVDKQIQLTAGGGQLAIAGGEGPASAQGGPVSAPAKSVSTSQYLWAILLAFGTGLLLTFTPCVLPMIPILSSIIVGQGGEKITKLRGGTLALTYVLGTSFTYTIAGAVAGATGEQLQAYFQNVWAIGIFSALLVLLALSMFGFYEIQMPSFVQSRLQERSSKIKGGSFIGVFIMGAISALIVGACVSPLLISALGVAIASKDALLGALIMFSMSIGMGIVLVALGLGAGTILPRAGAWMDRVKYFFGVLLLGVAIYLLSLMPQIPVLYLWAALFIITSIYLGALEPVPAGSSGWRYLFKGVGVVLLIWGFLALVGAFSGNRDITRPVSFSAIPSLSGGGAESAGTTAQAHVFQRVTTQAELDSALADARTAGKPVVLDFFATWCTDCVILERTTFADPKVVSLLSQRFSAIQVDVSDPNNPDTKAIKKRFGVFGPPALLFLDGNGKERKDLNFYGYKSASDFIDILNRV
jgi:thiol:disulfide interchange protein DsbD